MRKILRVAWIIVVASLFYAPFSAAAVTPPAGQKDVKTPPVVRAGEMQIPSEYGRVTERFDAAEGKLVVHMQDAHTNYEAQKNAAMILEDLINKYGLYLILVEGGSRDVSLNHYREQMSLAERKKMAEDSLKNGVIAGEEYLNISTDYPIKLQGIEARALYDENMKAFLEGDKLKEAAILFSGMLTTAVNSLRPRIYSKPLKELDDKRISFKEDKLSLADYVRYLADLARSRKINLSAYPNYNNLLGSVEFEKNIDFAEVEKERAGAIELLSKKLNQKDLDELLAKSVDFKAGKISQGQYHAYLKDLMDKAKLKMTGYPNLERYVKYVTMYEKIDSTALFKEMKALQSALEQSLASNEEQRRLLAIEKNLELLIEFISLKLTPDDFDYFRQNEGEFNVASWTRFLNDKLARYKLTQRIPENAQAVEKIMPPLKNFYIIARKRDDVFLDNTKKYMNEEGVNIAVLIAGGFHTPNLLKLFRENKISYIVVAPKVLKPTDEELYHKILTEGWAPAEK